MSKEKEYSIKIPMRKLEDFEINKIVANIPLDVRKVFEKDGWNAALKEAVNKIEKYFGVFKRPYKNVNEQLAEGVKLDLKMGIEGLLK